VKVEDFTKAHENHYSVILVTLVQTNDLDRPASFTWPLQMELGLNLDDDDFTACTASLKGSSRSQPLAKDYVPKQCPFED